MKGMFKNAESFNQPLDNWDTSNIDDGNLYNMFKGAKNALNTFPKLRETPVLANWKEQFNRAKPTKAANH